MDKNTKSGTGVKRVEKKLDGEDGMLGANPELRGSLPQLLRDDPGGGIWTGMPASHEINRWVSAILCHPIDGCLPSSCNASSGDSVGVWLLSARAR
jgi:hypothetical protein